MRTKIIILGNAYDHPRNQNDRVVIDPKGLSPCIQAGAGMGGGNIPMIPEIKRL